MFFQKIYFYTCLHMCNSSFGFVLHMSNCFFLFYICKSLVFWFDTWLHMATHGDTWLHIPTHAYTCIHMHTHLYISQKRSEIASCMALGFPVSVICLNHVGKYDPSIYAWGQLENAKTQYPHVGACGFYF